MCITPMLMSMGWKHWKSNRSQLAWAPTVNVCTVHSAAMNHCHQFHNRTHNYHFSASLIPEISLHQPGNMPYWLQAILFLHRAIYQVSPVPIISSSMWMRYTNTHMQGRTPKGPPHRLQSRHPAFNPNPFLLLNHFLDMILIVLIDHKIDMWGFSSMKYSESGLPAYYISLSSCHAFESPRATVLVTKLNSALIYPPCVLHDPAWHPVRTTHLLALPHSSKTCRT